MGKTAIILGASGLTGGLVLKKLLDDDRYETIKLFSRKSIGITNSKISENIGNLLELEKFKDDFTADEVFCCIGTTAKKTTDKAAYKNIDYGIPAKAAKLAKENKIKTFIVVSALGANVKSNVFYNRTKGEMEKAILKQHIPNTFILQPSIIEGQRDEVRSFEKIGIKLFKLMKPILLGKLKKYRAIKAEYIAQAMIYLANTKTKQQQIISSNNIKEIAINNK
ncbi:NAD(P)H-binding protein [bacterium AH-315-A23]|nr:NAD(P)H-binding protein [bacterium AH-315-A23]PHS53356.1 MAG: nucleoside-diphosphate sugar epimerase [Lutibacter sp.]